MEKALYLHSNSAHTSEEAIKYRIIFTIYHVYVSSLCVLARCQCTSEYKIIIKGEFIGASCHAWGSRDESLAWCFLTGGLQATNCPGAIKSDYGDFFYSYEICRHTGNVMSCHYIFSIPMISGDLKIMKIRVHI